MSDRAAATVKDVFMRPMRSRKLRVVDDGTRVKIRTPFYRATINRTGARLESLVADPTDFEWCIRRGLAEEVDGGFPGQLSLSRFEGTAERRGAEVTLTLTCHGVPEAVIDWGMTVRKTFTFFADRPGIRVDLRLENIGTPQTLSSFRLHNEIVSHASSVFFTRGPRGFAPLPFEPGERYVRRFSSGLAGVLRPADRMALLFVPDYAAVKEFYFYRSPELCTVEWFLKRMIVRAGQGWETHYWIVPASIDNLRDVDDVLRANGLTGRGVGKLVPHADQDIDMGGAARSAMDDFARAAARLVSWQAVGEKGAIEQNVEGGAGCWFSQALSTPLGAGFDLALPDQSSLSVHARVTLRAGQHAATQAYLAICDPAGEPYGVSAPAPLDIWTSSNTLTLDVGRLRGKTVRLALVGPEVLWTDVRLVSGEGADTVLLDSLSAWTSDVAELAGVVGRSRRLKVFVRCVTGTPALSCCCRDSDGGLVKTSVGRPLALGEPGGFVFEVAVGRAVSVEYTVRGGDRSVTGRTAIPPAVWDALEPGAVRLHVSPQGRDTWSGRRAEANRAETDGPFLTLGAAHDCVRRMKRRGVTRPVTVIVSAGAYRLARTLVLTPGDSGTAACPITYLAAPGASVIVSGGRRLEGPWESRSSGVWSCRLPAAEEPRLPFRSVRIGNEPMARTRWPSTGFLNLAPQGSDSEGRPVFSVVNGNLMDAPCLVGAELMARYTWSGDIFSVTHVDPQANQFTLSRPVPKGYAISHCHFENAQDPAMSTGHWYIEAASGALVLRPRPGDDPAQVEVVVPRLRELVRFQGDLAKSQHVRHIAFQGFGFSDALRPEQEEGIQSACLAGGALVMEAAEHCVLRANRFLNVEGYAVELRAGCRANLILDNEMNGMGAGGIRIGVVDKHLPATTGTAVIGNHIHDGGRLYPGAVGIWVGQSGLNVLARNHIHDLPYTGISVGWTWGRGENPAQGNRIDRNHIHHVMLDMHDGGAIYTLGWSYGTTVCHNLIHDVPNGNGIYLDEGSTGIRVWGNGVYRPKVGLFLHGARANLMENNVFVEAGDTHLILSDRANHMAANQLCLNVFVRGSRSALFLVAHGWNDRFFALSDFNLVAGWTLRERAIRDVDRATTLAAWRRLGHEIHSRMDAPRFVNAAKDDYRFKRHSPIWELGFKPIDAMWRLREAL